MAELTDPTASSALMEGVISTTAPNSAESGPPVDEYSCETLYIQNLNEKIKPEGAPGSFQ
jgi:U2 small nuclear ribonucleoprotein B''